MQSISSVPPLKVASMYWNLGGLEIAQAEAIKQLGHCHTFFRYDESIPPETEVVFFQGPYGSLLPLTRQLLDYHLSARPIVVYWFQQSLAMFKPEEMREYTSKFFSELIREFGPQSTFPRLITSTSPSFFHTKGARMGFLGDILWLSSRGLIDQLVLSSTVYAEYLTKKGIQSLVVPRGYHPMYGEIRNRNRDITLVWMGKLRTRSRRRKIYWLEKQLAGLGLTMHIYDGVERDFIFGEQRTEILNRAQFVLNINFSGPTDELSIRYFIAGANGAVILREPNANRYPFTPGKHLVECAVHEMPDTIQHYLRHPEERNMIGNNMLASLENDLTLERSIGTIMENVRQILSTGHPEE